MTQKKLKELCIKMQSISVFLYIKKCDDFCGKDVDVSRTQGVCQVSSFWDMCDKF